MSRRSVLAGLALVLCAPVPAGAADPPPAPTDLIAVPRPGAVQVMWTAPAGTAVTSYLLTAQPGGSTVRTAGGTTSAVLRGLTDGTVYTVTAVARNDGGASVPSGPSAPTIAGDGLRGPVSGAAAPEDWPRYTHDLRGSGAADAERLLSPASASRLRIHAKDDLGVPFDAQPTVVSGTVYVGDMRGSLHAYDPDLLQRWRTFLGTTGPVATCGKQVYGVDSSAQYATAAGRPTLYVGGGDASLYAVDATTGGIVWRTRLAASPDNFVFSSPLLWRGSLYVGVASFSDCPLTPGLLVKVDALTGRVQGTLVVSPPGCVGGGIWGSPTVDAQGRLFVATGTYARCAANDPVLETALLSVDPVGMRLVDAWQVPLDDQPGDGDFGSVPTVVDAASPGTSGHLVVIANKNGRLMAFERERLSAGPVWSTRIAKPGANPLLSGSISPAAYDGRRLYAGGNQTTVDGTTCPAAVRAVEPATGAVLWAYCSSDGPLIGAVAVANGVVLAAAGKGVVALDAATGQLLRRVGTADVFFGTPSVSAGAVYVGNRSTLYALRTG